MSESRVASYGRLEFNPAAHELLATDGIELVAEVFQAATADG